MNVIQSCGKALRTASAVRRIGHALHETITAESARNQSCVSLL